MRSEINVGNSNHVTPSELPSQEMNPLHSSFLHCYLLSISESCALYHQTLSCLPIFLNLNTTNFDHITIFCYLALGRLPVTSILRDFTIAPIPDLQFTPHIEIRGIVLSKNIYQVCYFSD